MCDSCGKNKCCCTKTVIKNGPKGDKGDRGADGRQGLIGLTGPQGDQGIPGTNGTNGTNGLNGVVTDILESIEVLAGDPSIGGFFSGFFYATTCGANILTKPGEEFEFVVIGKHIASLSSGNLSIGLELTGGFTTTPIVLSSVDDSTIKMIAVVKRITQTTQLVTFEFYKNDNLMTSTSLVTKLEILSSTFDLATSNGIGVTMNGGAGATAGEFIFYSSTLYKHLKP